jgi:hypothetical protein
LNNHPDGRVDQLRHHILTLGTRSESESDIEIVSSVELGKRLRLMREKAQNKRMNDPSVSAQDSFHDEVAYVLTTTSIPISVLSTVATDLQKIWQLQEGGSRRQKSSDFRKCEITSCSVAAINRTCARHPKRLMMACSTICHKKAKKQRRDQLASIQPHTDADMADAEIAALTESKDIPLPAPTQLFKHRWFTNWYRRQSTRTQ